MICSRAIIELQSEWVILWMYRKEDAQEQARNKKLENMQEDEEVREKNVKNKSRGYGEGRNMEN